MTTAPVTATTTTHPILLFDGVCNLCNGFVQFVIKIDPEAKLRFASLQSDAGRALLKEFDLPVADLKSVVLIYEGKAYTHSDAPLEATRHLGGLWPVFRVLKIVPRFIRDGIYNWIARNRYRWFGKQESCWMPTPDLQRRFL
ncbi:MAG: thiol-disulfide oxidoreductase DCC family protein [Bacteroidota bacterium]